MTKGELEARQGEIQESLNKLGMSLISQNQDGISLLTEQTINNKRLSDGDFSADLEFADAPIGEKVVDNDSIG